MQRVGNYEIVRLLARGGMAVVYLVRQPALDRDVVLKRLDLDSDDPTLAQRFVHEARLAATLDHPNIVTLFDFFEHDGVPYIAMEYVAGGSLRSLIGRLRPAQLYGLVEGVLAGLGHAERRQIAHRDLKPENLLLTSRGDVKIADFGIARAYNALTPRITMAGIAVGTPAYMAPEQALDEPLGPYTDLYALGVIVYELLAGRPPFDADTPVGVLYCHVHRPVPPLAELVPEPRPALCEWVEWLLSKAPAERPQSAAEAWDALEEIAVAELGPYWRRGMSITAPEPADPPPEEPKTTATGETVALIGEPTPRQPTPIPARRTRRRRAIAAAAAFAGAAAVAGYAALSEGDPPTTPRPDTPSADVLPYDFNADGRQELVVAMLGAAPRGRAATSGVVLVHRGRGRPWHAITEAGADVGGRPKDRDAFGSGLASADFDGDGNVDLAIGTPGKNRVSVLYGESGGILDGPTKQFPASKMGLPNGTRGYGHVLLGRDLDDDGYDDLVVGAPGTLPAARATGVIQVLRGGRDGLHRDRAWLIPRPPGRLAGFGTRVRTGDVDRDGDVDLVEGGPATEIAPGHGTYCAGTPHGPSRCRDFSGPAGTSSLAIADVDGDRFADVVQGDDGTPAGTAGEVRLWLGSSRGPRSQPIRITQDSPGVPGNDEPGDQFGAVVEAADVDSDGYADLILAAIGENEGAGRITHLRGSKDGWTAAGGSSFDQDSREVPGRAAPGRRFGSTLTALELSGDERIDVAVAVRGAATDAAVMVVEGGPGLFAPDETRSYVLTGASEEVDAPPGGRIRLARAAGA